jgi:diadenosine tetraphosphate (Ap4A) HIT family hydrolase
MRCFDTNDFNPFHIFAVSMDRSEYVEGKILTLPKDAVSNIFELDNLTGDELINEV